MSDFKRLDDRLNRIEDKVDKLVDKIDQKLQGVENRLDSMDKTLVKQEANLEAHMKRSDLLEESQGNLENAVKPILKVYTIAWGLTTIFAGVSFILATIITVLKIIGVLI